MATMAQIITAVEKTLYQSSGPSVQVYSESIIQQMIEDAYRHIVCGKIWWPQTIIRQTRTLDGSTGAVTANLTSITEYNDIYAVYRPQSRRPLPVLPMATNSSLLTGTTPMYTEATTTANKLFRVWPLASTGDLNIVGRVSAGTFATSDVVPFDELVLRHFAAWTYFTDDQSLASAEKHRMLYEKRLAELTNNAFSQPILLDNQSDTIPDRWSEGGY